MLQDQVIMTEKFIIDYAILVFLAIDVSKNSKIFKKYMPCTTA
ncbi:hypothetical protein [Pectinatus frisingensis]